MSFQKVMHKPAPFASCARPEVAARIQSEYSALGGWPGSDKLPIVYSPVYNVGFLGLENLHPFDSKKYQKVVRLLEGRGWVREGQLVAAQEASHHMLLDVHSEAYLHSLNNSPRKVAEVTELAPLALLPSCLLRHKILRPMRYMAGGTMMAAALAQERGWAINLGGGMHHASHGDGGGWCVYDDIFLAIRKLRDASQGLVRTAMIIDLDVHQGNGLERDKLHFRDDSVFIVDVYNAQQYPQDEAAKKGIDVAVELGSGVGDAEYLQAVQQALHEGFRLCPHPDLVVYNAGTDVLESDPLGQLAVSRQGVLKRDAMVWTASQEAGSPLVMVLSGGYTAASTPCIADSLENLLEQFDLTLHDTS